MATEVWLRNPNRAIMQAATCGATNLVWDRGLVRKRRMSPRRAWVDRYYPASVAFRILMVGDQGAAELRRNRDMENPHAVYPVWDYTTDDIDILHDLLENPVGDNPELTGDLTKPPDERPVAGQEHRVVVIRPPDATSLLGRAFYVELAEMQREHPEAIIHVHGLYSYRYAFGQGFGAADIDPSGYVMRGNGCLPLPTGKQIKLEQANEYRQWISLLGFSVSQLVDPWHRCSFAIKSAMWAGENWGKTDNFLSRPGGAVDPDAPVHSVATVPRHSRKAFAMGDKWACDTCSVQRTCKLYREGSVCAVPGSEANELSRLFKTRDSDQIIEGLGKVMEMMSDRATTAVALEATADELDSETTKILKILFDSGIKLAKLVDPALAAAGATRVNVGVSVGGLPAPDQQPTAVLVSRIFAEIEATGIPRDQITPEMVASEIAARVMPRQAIEATSSFDE